MFLSSSRWWSLYAVLDTSESKSFNSACKSGLFPPHKSNGTLDPRGI